MIRIFCFCFIIYKLCDFLSILQELIEHFAHLVTVIKDIECIIECVGIIANVNIPEVDFNELLESNNLISWMIQFVNNGNIICFFFFLYCALIFLVI